MKAFFLMILMFVTLNCFALEADLIIQTHESGTFWNTDCLLTDSCSLLRVDYILEDYSVEVSGNTDPGTRIIISYETDSVEHLEDYVFVQFMRGCQYDSEILNGRKVTSFDNSMRMLYGKPVRMYFPEWTIDSVDDDPAFYSYSDFDLPRHDAYRWSDKPWLTDMHDAHFYGKEKPVQPRLFLKDIPTGSTFFHNGVARNTIMEFRICIYKNSDVPRYALKNDTTFAKPIFCFEWKNFHVYNFETGSYELPKELNISHCPAEQK